MLIKIAKLRWRQEGIKEECLKIVAILNRLVVTVVMII